MQPLCSEKQAGVWQVQACLVMEKLWLSFPWWDPSVRRGQYRLSSLKMKTAVTLQQC